MQIRARLTLRYVLMAAGILAVVLLAVWWTYKRHTEAAFFQSLESKATLTAQTAFREAERMRPLPYRWPEQEGGSDTLPYRENVSLYNDAYERVFTLDSLVPPVSVKVLQEIQQKERMQFRNQNLYALGIVMNSPANRPFTIVAEGYFDPNALERLQNILILGFVFGMIALAGAGWYYAGQALAPVSRIMDQVNALQPDDLSKRLESGGNGDELARLAATFNHLLDRVEHAFRLQRMFLSNVSHELKNPLMAMRAQLDVTLQRERDPAAYKNALQSVLEDLRALSDLEEKLLQLARIYNDPYAIAMHSIRLDELVWQARDQLQKNNPTYKAQVQMKALPELEDGLLVMANESLLRTALLNLMHNACKYAPDRRVLLNVWFRPGGAHVIEVCDNGPGIAPEDLPFIFEPFYRSPAVRTRIKGTGVGLSLVRSILQLHHIALEVRSGESGGAVFRLLFPPWPQAPVTT